MIGVLDTVWGSIENKIEDKINPIPKNYPNIKIKIMINLDLILIQIYL